jgi:hypothetical protein
MRFTAAFMGRSLTYTYEVREHEPGVRFVMSTDEGPTCTVEGDPGGRRSRR